MPQLGTGPPPAEEASAQEPVAKLRRSRQDRVVAGVCGGLGTYLGVDPLWFRLAFVVLTVGGGAGILIYLVAWLIIPEQAGDEELVVRKAGSTSDGTVAVGVALVAVGLMLLFNTVFPWFDRLMWPLMVVAAGLALLYTGRRRGN